MTHESLEEIFVLFDEQAEIDDYEKLFMINWQQITVAMVTCFVGIREGVVLVVKVRVLELLECHHLSLCLLEESEVHQKRNPC